MRGQILKRKIRASWISFAEYFPEFTEGHILDLGCGPGDIPVRFARALPSCRITGVDASEPMISLAVETVKQAGLADRIAFRCERFPDGVAARTVRCVNLQQPASSCAQSPAVLVSAAAMVKPGSPVLVMDLLRPDSSEEAQAIVDRYAAKEPEILQE